MQVHFAADQMQVAPDSQVINIRVDADEVVTSGFLGVGVQCSAYPWWELTDAEWDRVFRRLTFMRVSLMRTMQSAFYYWHGSDSLGQPVYNFDSTYEQKLHRLLDWCEQNSVQVILGEWGAPTDFTGAALANDDPKWTSMVGDFLTDLFRRRDYRCIRYFNLINEPHGSWSTTAGRFDEWKSAILNLHAELHRRGMRKRVAIAAPDADSEWMHKTLADRDLRAATGLYDVHWYVTRDEISNGLVEQKCRALCDQIARLDPGKPFVLGELGIVDGKTNDDRQPNVYGFGYGVDMADAAIQLMRGGCSGFIAWYLDDAMHFFGDGDVVRRDCEPPPEDAYSKRKVWGMWNSLGDRMGDPQDAQLRPWFYTWSLLARYFPAGCKIVSVDVGDTTQIAAVAARVPEGGGAGVSLAIISRTNLPQVVTIHVPALNGRVSLARFDYFDLDADDRPDAWRISVDEDGNDVFPQPTSILHHVDLQRGIELEILGRGVVILTTIQPKEPVAN